MDSLEVHSLLKQVQDIAARITSRSDSDRLVDECSDLSQILRLLNDEHHDVIAEQMLERFWRLTLRWYFFPFDQNRGPFEAANDELYELANMRVAILDLYGDMYGEGLEAEARAIGIALKLSSRDFLKAADGAPATQPSSANRKRLRRRKPKLKLVVTN